MSTQKRNGLLLLAALLLSGGVRAQSAHERIVKELNQKEELYGEATKTIWNFAEVGYQEDKSSALLEDMLSQEGFKVQKGVAGIPTAFVSSYGEGQPVIGILGEYDALPGLSQNNSSGTSPEQLLLRDEGLSQLSYVDIAHPERNWYVPIPNGRDLQLVGQGRVLVGTGNGYEEHDIKTGTKVTELTIFKGTLAARRLRNGNTLLTGLNWQGKEGIVLIEVDKGGSIIKTVHYPGFDYVRLVRETDSGTFLITADDRVFEGKPDGTIVWQATLDSRKKSQHAWQAVRLGDGRTVVSGGFSANLQIFDKTGTLIDTLSGPAAVHPYFYAGFQILKNNNIIVTNWQGHGPALGAKGTQLLGYSPTGQLVWSWKQDPAHFSSIQGVIVLDGLDLDRLHVEDSNGQLSPVKWL